MVAFVLFAGAPAGAGGKSFYQVGGRAAGTLSVYLGLGLKRFAPERLGSRQTEQRGNTPDDLEFWQFRLAFGTILEIDRYFGDAETGAMQSEHGFHEK